MVFANQIDIFQRFAKLDHNAAQQQANLLSAMCSSTPMLVGFTVSHRAWPMQEVILVALGLEVLGIMVLLAGATGKAGPGAILPALYVFYAMGYGAITSTLPVLGMQEVSEERRPAFSQRFFACLAVGSLVGILAAGVAQVLGAYDEGFMFALLALLVGGALFMFRGSSDPAAVTAGMLASHGSGQKPSGSPHPWPLLVLVPFYGAYLQWTTSWYVQAAAMDSYFYGYQVPVCFLQAVERFTALGLLMLLGWLWKDTGRSATPGCRFRTPNKGVRLSLGCLFAGAALLVAATTEVVRRDAPRLAALPSISSLHMVWLVPQYVLIAMAEAFIFPAQTEWAGGSPWLIGLGTAVQAAAAALLAMVLPFLQAWVPTTGINDGRYEYYFCALAMACFASAALFAAMPAQAFASSVSQAD